jgi:transcriptional regulator with XRE-family HTH domain
MADLTAIMATKTEKILKEFGDNLQQLRKAKGFSTREFAYEADISHSSVGRLEAGLSNPTLTTLIKIAEVLEVDLSQLVSSNYKTSGRY